MRLSTLRACWIFDRKRGAMISRKPVEEFTMDEVEEKETIHSLLTLKKVTVIDENFIPAEARYIVLSYISYTSKDGFPRLDGPGAEVTLSAETATPLLIEGLIKPVDPKQWTLKKLLYGDVVKNNEPKRMFDVDEAPKENWVRRQK